MATRTAARPEEGLLPLFIGILGPPVVWAVRFMVNYVLVPYVCGWGRIEVLHLVTLAALAVTALTGWVVWRRWREAGEGTQVELGGTTTRTRFMALFGMLSSGFFFLVMVAEGLANVFVHPCQTAGAPIA